MNNIDHGIHYIVMMDTETANTLTRADGSLDMTSVFVYDIGWQVTDKRGILYEEKSYIVNYQRLNLKKELTLLLLMVKI